MSSATERYLPCLLSRLTDDNPSKVKEDQPVLLSLNQLKLEIMRNIQTIFNSRSHVKSPLYKDDLYNYSVVDFGLNDFCGCSHNEHELERIKREIAQAIARYEPRVSPDSVAVEAYDNEDGKHNLDSSVFKLRISCQINVKPLEGEILLISYLDLESGSADVEA